MPDIRPPFTGLQFYFGYRSEAEAMVDVCRTLISDGAQLAGSAVILKPSIEPRFGCPADTDTDEVVISTVDDIASANPITIPIRNATGQTGRTERLTLLRISEQAAALDRHPICLWTEGDAFENIDDAKPSGRSRQVGMALYRKFVHLVHATRPSYAAITHEYDMECPADLYVDPSSYAFIDFYVSEEFVGGDRLREVAAAAEFAVVEDLGHGLYVSGFAPFNLRHKNTDQHVRERISSATIEAIVKSRKRVW